MPSSLICYKITVLILNSSSNLRILNFLRVIVGISLKKVIL